MNDGLHRQGTPDPGMHTSSSGIDRAPHPRLYLSVDTARGVSLWLWCVVGVSDSWFQALYLLGCVTDRQVEQWTVPFHSEAGPFETCNFAARR
jgi:hypothetical protein